jgi:heat shock protein HslJ
MCARACAGPHQFHSEHRLAVGQCDESNDQANDHRAHPENYTIIFNADGTLAGKADCNTFDGTYSQQNGFTIKLGASTMMYCGDASLDAQYLQLLSSVAAGGPDGAGGLALETAGGEQRMLFKNGGLAPKP